MYQQIEILARARIEDLRREAEQERLAASAGMVKSLNTAAQSTAPSAPKRIAAGTLIWAGRRLSDWGSQLQGDYGPQRMKAATK